MTDNFKLTKTATYTNIVVDGKIVGQVFKSCAPGKYNGFAPNVTPTLPKTSQRAAARALVASLNA